jgi:hypothetical protein
LQIESDTVQIAVSSAAYGELRFVISVRVLIEDQSDFVRNCRMLVFGKNRWEISREPQVFLDLDRGRDKKRTKFLIELIRGTSRQLKSPPNSCRVGRRRNCRLKDLAERAH